MEQQPNLLPGHGGVLESKWTVSTAAIPDLALAGCWPEVSLGERTWDYGAGATGFHWCA